MKWFVHPGEGKQAVLIDAPQWAGEPWEFIAALKRVVSRWINETADGSRVKAENHGKFTLIDLAGYTPDCFLKTTTLGQFMRAEGISLCTITVGDVPKGWEMGQIVADANLYEGGEE